MKLKKFLAALREPSTRKLLLRLLVSVPLCPILLAIIFGGLADIWNEI